VGGGERRNHSALYQVADMASQSDADKVEAAVRALHIYIYTYR